MTNEQREKLREWLEKQGYKSDVEGYTVIEEEGQEGTTEGD